MASNSSVYDAAVAVLKEERRALSPFDICRIAIERGLYKTQGKTPQNTFSSIITQHLKNNPTQSPFCRVSNGLYIYREYADPSNTGGASSKLAEQEPAKQLQTRSRAQMAATSAPIPIAAAPRASTSAIKRQPKPAKLAKHKAGQEMDRKAVSSPASPSPKNPTSETPGDQGDSPFFDSATAAAVAASRKRGRAGILSSTPSDAFLSSTPPVEDGWEKNPSAGSATAHVRFTERRRSVVHIPLAAARRVRRKMHIPGTHHHVLPPKSIFSSSSTTPTPTSAGSATSPTDFSFPKKFVGKMHKMSSHLHSSHQQYLSPSRRQHLISQYLVNSDGEEGEFDFESVHSETEQSQSDLMETPDQENSTTNENDSTQAPSNAVQSTTSSPHSHATSSPCSVQSSDAPTGISSPPPLAPPSLAAFSATLPSSASGIFDNIDEHSTLFPDGMHHHQNESLPRQSIDENATMTMFGSPLLLDRVDTTCLDNALRRFSVSADDAFYFPPRLDERDHDSDSLSSFGGSNPLGPLSFPSSTASSQPISPATFLNGGVMGDGPQDSNLMLEEGRLSFLDGDSFMDHITHALSVSLLSSDPTQHHEIDNTALPSSTFRSMFFQQQPQQQEGTSTEPQQQRVHRSSIIHVKQPEQPPSDP